VEGSIWRASEPPAPIHVKPKELRQIRPEEEQEAAGLNHKGKHNREGVDAKEPSPDVYNFLADSESPPLASWAHCTFVQQQRKRQAAQRTATPQWVSTGDEERMGVGGRGGGEEEEEGLKGEEEEKVGGGGPDRGEREGGGGGGDDDDDDDRTDGGPIGDIFTCVECSIYFQKRVHLREHMAEHVQSLTLSPGGRWAHHAMAPAHLHCAECGWTLPSRAALVEHRGRHRESRARILEEIQKLENTGAGKPEEMVGDATDPGSRDISAVAEPDPVLGPLKRLDPDVVDNTPTLSSVPRAVDLDPALVLCADPSTPAGSKPGPVRALPRARAAPAKGRRLICPTCNFSTKTSQAMANHAKTHNRTKPPARRKSQRAQFPALEAPGSSPASQSGSTSSVTFMTSGPTPLREHLHLLPGEDSTAPFSQTKELVFKCIGNRRANRRGRDWTEHTQTGLKLESKRRLGLADEEEGGGGGGRGEFSTVAELKDASGRLKSHARPAFTQGNADENAAFSVET